MQTWALRSLHRDWNGSERRPRYNIAIVVAATGQDSAKNAPRSALALFHLQFPAITLRRVGENSSVRSAPRSGQFTGLQEEEIPAKPTTVEICEICSPTQTGCTAATRIPPHPPIEELRQTASRPATDSRLPACLRESRHLEHAHRARPDEVLLCDSAR